MGRYRPIGVVLLSVGVLTSIDARGQERAPVQAPPVFRARVDYEALQALVSFQPTTARTFATSEVLQLFMPLFWRSNSSIAEMTLTVRGDLANLSRSETAIVERTEGDRHSAALDTTLPLGDLPAGRYTLEVTTRLTNGQTATRAVAIEVQ